jgi:hypothetical protein
MDLHTQRTQHAGDLAVPGHWVDSMRSPCARERDAGQQNRRENHWIEGGRRKGGVHCCRQNLPRGVGVGKLGATRGVCGGEDAHRRPQRRAFWTSTSREVANDMGGRGRLKTTPYNSLRASSMSQHACSSPSTPSANHPAGRTGSRQSTNWHRRSVARETALFEVTAKVRGRVLEQIAKKPERGTVPA